MTSKDMEYEFQIRSLKKQLDSQKALSNDLSMKYKNVKQKLNAKTTIEIENIKKKYNGYITTDEAEKLKIKVVIAEDRERRMEKVIKSKDNEINSLVKQR